MGGTRIGLITAAALAALALPAAAHAAAETPPDPLFATEQWALQSTGPLNAPEAWALGGYGDGTTVAVVDTGVDETQPDLAGALWTNPGEIPGNGKDDDGDGFVDDVHGADFVNHDGDPQDDNGHGTHVAGIIAAQRDDVGTVGLAPGAKIMAIKVLDASEGGNTGDVAAGIRYAIAHGADVVNVSINGNTASPALASAVQAAQDAGIPIVAAAGNDGRDLDTTPSYPASLPGDALLAVAAQAPGGLLAAFSNFGSASVSLAAPGEDIASTKLGGGWEDRSGTSMAAPFVSATLALIHGARPDLRGAALVDALRAGESRPAGLDGLLQGGELDPVAALKAVVDPSLLAAADAPAPFALTARVARLGHAQPNRPRRARAALVTWTVDGDDTAVTSFRIATRRGVELADVPAGGRGAWLRTRSRKLVVTAIAADGTTVGTSTVSLR